MLRLLLWALTCLSVSQRIGESIIIPCKLHAHITMAFLHRSTAYHKDDAGACCNRCRNTQRLVSVLALLVFLTIVIILSGSFVGLEQSPTRRKTGKFNQYSEQLGSVIVKWPHPYQLLESEGTVMLKGEAALRNQGKCNNTVKTSVRKHCSVVNIMVVKKHFVLVCLYFAQV